MIRTWRLDAGQQTVVLACQRDRLAEAVYWGALLPPDEDLETLWRCSALDVTGGMLDANPDLSICPEASRTFPGQPGLILRNSDGRPLLPKFCFENESLSGEDLSLTFIDQTHVLAYTAIFRSDAETGLVTAQARLHASRPIHLHWLSAPVLPAPQSAIEMIDVSGRWCREFQLNRIPWTAGMRYRENRTGRTGHEHFPALILPGLGATNACGEAWALHYGWSGGHRMIAEELPDGRRQIQFGHAARMEVEPREEFETAPLYLSYSVDGINGCAVAFQRHLRDRIVRFPEPDRPRPVHYNCWEAVYFDHDLPKLKDIASRAAALGAERFVLDDGWFGERDDDTRALSDWQVDPRKYPEGLDPLISHVHGEGMSFGIWFEPEMINPDSNVHREHPDWALGSEDQLLGRHQKAINMALPEVRDFLYDRIAPLLRDHAIDYIKWDHNRVLPMPDANQARGTYELIDRLRAEFPEIEIESCASGGGRIDFGILERTHRVWLSDSNDALERLHIQHNAALFLPACVTGSHVGPRTCHTSGRTLSIGFRAWVAAQRCMGFEMDPRELTEEEAETLTRVTSWWKANRHWLMKADILRLDTVDPAIIAEQQLAADAKRFVVFAGRAATSAQIAPRPLRLTRLDPEARYAVRLANADEIPKLSRGATVPREEPIVLSGQYLTRHGLSLPWSFPQSMWVIEGERI